MTAARYALLVAGVLVVASIIVPTAGISSASLERTATGEVVTDDEAYLGIERNCHNGSVRVTVRNRLPGDQPLTVDLTANGSHHTVDHLGVGDSETVSFSAVGPDDSIVIEATGTNVAIHVTRPPPPGC
jgi:hypothetical protein